MEPAPGNFPGDMHCDLQWQNVGRFGDTMTLVDVTVVGSWSDGISAASQALNAHCAAENGYAARKAERRKQRKYGPLVPGNTDFVPFAMEIFGRFGEGAKRCMSIMATESRRRRGWPTWYWWYFFAPRVATALARGNCAMVQEWMAMHAQRMAAVGAPAPSVGDDADEGPEALGPNDGRHLRGQVRALQRAANDGAAIAARVRAAMDEPVDEWDDVVMEELEGLRPPQAV